MSQGTAESIREGQFGAIGTRRDQWQTVAMQPVLSSSGGPVASSFTATTNNSSATTTGLYMHCSDAL